MDSDDQLQLLTTASDEESTMSATTPGSQATIRRKLGVLFV